MKLTKFFLGLALMVAAVELSAGAQGSVATKKAAIQKACASGALSPEDCKAKLAELNGNDAAQGGGQTYAEPRGRYTMTVPAGWTIVPEQDSVKITHGDSWARFQTVYAQQEPLAVAHAAASAMKTMCSRFQPVNDSPFQQGSHQAAGMTVDASFAGKDGSHNVSMLFTALAAGGGNYVTMTSSTPQPGGNVNGTMMQMFGSIRFSGE